MLTAAGYEGSYRRDAFSPCVRTSDSALKDGVCIFYRRELLELVDDMKASDYDTSGKELGKTMFSRLRFRTMGNTGSHSQLDGAPSEVPLPSIGLEVTGDVSVEQILDGTLQIETREYGLPSRLVDVHIGIISCPNGLDKQGAGEALIVGTVTFKECYKYADKAHWEKDAAQHLGLVNTPLCDENFRQWKEGRPKFAWVVGRVARLPEPRQVTGQLQREFRSLFTVGVPDEVVIVNTHLESEKSDKGARNRDDQVASLLETLDSFLERGRKSHSAMQQTPPVLVLGDFNATPDEPCCARISQHGPGFTNSYAEAGYDLAIDKDIFSSYKKRVGAYKPGTHKYWIDYIWRSPRLVTESVQEMVSAEACGEDLLPNTAWPSDHLSILATFRIKS